MQVLIVNADVAKALLPSLVSVRSYAKADGTRIGDQTAIRHRRVLEPPPIEEAPKRASPEPAPSALDALIESHGGAPGLRIELGRMSGSERAIIADALARLGGISVAGVASKLGLKLEDFWTDPTSGVAQAEDVPGAEVAEPVADPSADFDREVSEIEDREDLAEELGKDPHSDAAKGMLQRFAGKILARLMSRPCGI